LKDRVEKLGARKDYVAKDVDGKLEKLTQGNEAMYKEILRKEEENINLVKTIQDIKKDVEIRENQVNLVPSR
jgi:hypothetical protein